MTPDERDRLTTVEVKVEGMEKTLSEIHDDVKSLLAKAENAKGGWWTLTVIGGIGTIVGGMLVKFVPFVGKGP